MSDKIFEDRPEDKEPDPASENPTPEAQLAAVRQDGHTLQHIKNPTPEVVAYFKSH